MKVLIQKNRMWLKVAKKHDDDQENKMWFQHYAKNAIL
jgi:hypothetical protein